MPQTELGGLAQARRERVQPTVVRQLSHRLGLFVGRPRRAHEIRVIGVREPIGTGPCGSDDRAFLENQDRVVCTRRREHIRNRLCTLRVRDGMPSTIEHPERQSFSSSDVRQERRALKSRRTDLEVRRARPAHGSPAEQRTAEVGATAARAPHDSTRRTFERRLPRPEDACFLQHAQRFGSAFDVELITLRLVERPAMVGADLGVHAELPQESKGAACHRRLRDVDVHRHHAAAAQVEATRRVEQPGQLGEAVAIHGRRDLRELAAQIFRE